MSDSLEKAWSESWTLLKGSQSVASSESTIVVMLVLRLPSLKLLSFFVLNLVQVVEMSLENFLKQSLYWFF